MRTKSLVLAAAALVAGLVSTQAQSNVYSLNIVGYVNRPMQGNSQFTLVANPLSSPTNTYAGVLQGLPVGWSVTKWTGSGYTPAAGRVGFGTGWSPAAAGTNSFNPGEAVFVKAASGAVPFTNSFVGNVVTGTLTNSLTSGFSMIGNAIPVGGAVTNAGFAFVPPNGSQIQKWKEDGIGGYITYGKVAFGSGWTPSVPSIDVGQGFFVNMTAPFNWIRTFNP